MNNISTKRKISVILKILSTVLAIFGVLLSLARARTDGYSHPTKRLFYFTGLSNIWIALIFLILLVFPYLKRFSGSTKIKNALYILKYVFTISITLTAIIFCAVLAPGASNDNYNAWTFSSLLTHVVVPILSIVDFFIDDYRIVIRKISILYTAVPPLAYLIFAVILGAFGFDFGRGDTFPYFFLNFDSPAGFFGFSSEMPHIVGSFYWIVFILALIIALGALYRKLYNKFNDK